MTAYVGLIPWYLSSGIRNLWEMRQVSPNWIVGYFEKFCNYLNPGGIIITDNINFHGLVKNKELIQSKNVQGIVDKIERYIEFLDNNKDYITKYYDIGDGLSVTFKKNNENR